MSQAGANVVRIRQGVWPETQQAAVADLTVTLDDKGKVAEMHARLIALLNSAPDPHPELAGHLVEEYVHNG